MSAGLYLKITVLLAVLTGLFVLVGLAVGLYFGDPIAFMVLFLILAGVFNFVSYYFSDSLVVRMSKAKIIKESDNPALFAAVKNVAQKAGIPMPRVGIVDSPQPNAFATGRGPSKAVVCATSSILQTLTPDELEAVLGHEIGHVVHRDVLMSSVAATIAGAISAIANVALFSMMFGGVGGNSKSRGGASPLVMLMAVLLVPVSATFIRLGISRNDEYNADEYGAKLTRNPVGLINALQKISTKVASRPMTSRRGQGPSPATSSLWIVNPFKGNSLVELFSTHPTTEKRVQRLKKIGREMNLYIP